MALTAGALIASGARGHVHRAGVGAVAGQARRASRRREGGADLRIQAQTVPTRTPPRPTRPDVGGSAGGVAAVRCRQGRPADGSSRSCCNRDTYRRGRSFTETSRSWNVPGRSASPRPTPQQPNSMQRPAGHLDLDLGDPPASYLVRRPGYTSRLELQRRRRSPSTKASYVRHRRSPRRALLTRRSQPSRRVSGPAHPATTPAPVRWISRSVLGRSTPPSRSGPGRCLRQGVRLGRSRPGAGNRVAASWRITATLDF